MFQNIATANQWFRISLEGPLVAAVFSYQTNAWWKVNLSIQSSDHRVSERWRCDLSAKALLYFSSTTAAYPLHNPVRNDGFEWLGAEKCDAFYARMLQSSILIWVPQMPSLLRCATLLDLGQQHRISSFFLSSNNGHHFIQLANLDQLHDMICHVEKYKYSGLRKCTISNK